MTPEEILDIYNARLAHALAIVTPAESKSALPKYYGFEKGPEAWLQIIPRMVTELWETRPYALLELGCHQGAKAPFWAAWGCARYLGLDMHISYVETARQQWDCGICQFAICNVVTEAWPRGFDVIAMSYVFQHFRLSEKRAVLNKMREANPRLILLVDAYLRDGTLEDCAKEYEPVSQTSLAVPYPLSELRTMLPAHEVTAYPGWLYVGRRK